MAGRLSAYQYRPGRSVLHRLPGGLKLGALLVLSLCALGESPVLLIPPAVLVLAGALAAGIRPWELFRGSRPLLFLALGVILLRGIRGFPPALDLPGLLAGLRFGAAMVLSFAAGALFYSVTTMREIRETLEGLFPARRLSLGISLMLGYIPRFFELWENANLAWEARRGRGGFSRIAVLVPLVTERMMEAAAETAAALESRRF